MTDFLALADADKRLLVKYIHKVQKELEKAPGGKLKINRRNGRSYYFQRYVQENDRVVYIPQKNMSRVRDLAQKEYNLRLLKNLKARLSAVESLERHFPEESIESIYDHLSDDRKALITPLIPSEDQYIQTWQKQPYEGRGFREDDTTSFFTDREERVRSKSEMIIANTLYHAGIPYKYECPLILGRKVFYPDFTLLDIRHRKEFYLEHFGMMDDPSYANQFIRKLDFYQSYGIYPGEQLLMTFESRNQAFDIRFLKQLLDHHLTQTLQTPLDKE